MRRLLPFIIVLVFLAGLFMGVPLLLQPDRHRAEIAAYLTQRLHHPVTLGKIDAGMLPPSLKVSAVSLQGSDGKPFLQSDRVDVGLDLLSLFRLKIRPKSVSFSHWSIVVTRRPDGSWNLDEWLAPAQGAKGGDPWPLRTVALKSGEVHIVDPGNPATKELLIQGIEGDWDSAQSAAHVTGTLASTPPVTMTAEGKGRLTAGEWTADLRLAEEGREWILQLADQKGVLDAKGQSKLWRLEQALDLARFLARLAPVETIGEGHMMQDWRTHFTWEGTNTSLYHAATISGGLTEVNGNLTGGPAGLHLHLKGTAQDLPISVLEGGEAPLLTDAKLNALVTEFDMALSTRSLRSLSAKGSFDLHQGRYRLPAAAAKSLAKAKTMAYLKDKFPEFLTRGLPFEKVSAVVDISGGMATVSNGRLWASNIQAAMAGKVDLASRGSDAYVRLQIHETDPAKIRLIPVHYIYTAAGRDQIQPMFGRLQGTWQDWTLRAISTNKIPAGIKSHLQQTLK